MVMVSIIGACLFSLASSNCRSANEPVQVPPAQSTGARRRMGGAAELRGIAALAQRASIASSG
jgi:hypothetical protein